MDASSIAEDAETMRYLSTGSTGSMIVEKPVEYPVEWSADFINWFYDL